MSNRLFIIILTVACLIVFTANLVAQNKGLEDAVSVWLFDEGSGAAAINAVNGGPEGTVVGNASWENGLYSKALNFDGVDDAVEVVSNPLVGAHSLTIQAYINPSSIPDFESSKIFNIALLRDTDGFDRFMLDMLPASGKWILSHFMSIGSNRSDPEDELMASGPLHPFNEWYHVAMVFDSTGPDNVKIKHYVNHILEHEWDYNFGELAEGEVFIGERYQEKGSGLRNYFCGLMDNVVLHNKALTSEEFMPIPGEVGITAEDESDLPRSFALHQNYPNPFNPVTTIGYDLPSGSVKNVKLEIFNLLGVPVVTLINAKQHPGYYSARWDGNNSEGIQVPPGIYFYRLYAENYSFIRKMVLVK